MSAVPTDLPPPVFSRWVAATALGFLLGDLAARATLNFGVGPLTPLSAIPKWALTGLAGAALQCQALRSVLPRRGLWLTVTTVAFAVAGPIAAIPSADPRSYGVTWAIGGALIGVVQWLALRRTLQRALWWLVATAAGFGLAGLLRAFGFDLLPEEISRSLASFLLWVIPGLVIALVTGLALHGLIPHRRQR